MESNIVMIAAISASQLLFASGVWAAAALPDLSAAPKDKAAVSASAVARKKRDRPQPTVNPVDINSASKAELMKLPAVGDADAGRIIAGRPYLSKAHLVTRKVLSEGQYLGIKSMIMAGQKGTPAPRKTAGK